MENDTLLSALSGALQGKAVEFWGDEMSAQNAFTGIDAKRRHVWLAAWAQMSLRAERVADADNVELWRSRLRKSPSRQILVKAGFGQSSGMIGALGRLHWRGLTDAQTYCRLGDLLGAKGPARKLITHASSLTQDFTDVVDALPDPLRKKSLMDSLAAQDDLKRDVAERLAWRLVRYGELCPDTAKQFLGRLLVGDTDPDELLHHLSFPAPPWVGDDVLKPIDTPDRLRSAAKRFRNCLSARTSCVYAGQSYYYELDGRAIVEFDHIAGLGWEISEIRGVKNAEVDTSVRDELRRRLSQAPSLISPVLPLTW